MYIVQTAETSLWIDCKVCSITKSKLWLLLERHKFWKKSSRIVYCIIVILRFCIKKLDHEVIDTIIKLISDNLTHLTFEASKQRLELFFCYGVMYGSWVSSSINFAGRRYWWLYEVRRQITNLFIWNIKSMHSDLTASFFSDDKEMSHAKSIQSVFSIASSICLWHMKQAVKQKVSEFRKLNAKCLKSDEESWLLSLIDMHYHRSSFSTDASQICLQSKVLVALWSFCSDDSEDSLHKYL